MHVAVLAEMVTKILALVTAFDEVSANQEAMQDAALQFDGLLQVSHFLWPPFLFGALYRRGIRGVAVQFEALVTNLPFCKE